MLAFANGLASRPLPLSAGRTTCHVVARPAAMAATTYELPADAVSGAFGASGQIVSDASASAEVLSTQDIVVGTILAFILAFGYSFLNGQSTSTSFVSWPSQRADADKVAKNGTGIMTGQDDDEEKTFNADGWREMSREENYVLYNTRIRQKSNEGRRALQSAGKTENKLVLLALLALFVPIFSVEFFFALSRQFICELGMEGEIVHKLCSPVVQ